MGIVNRTKDPSEQMQVVQSNFGVVGTGLTLPVCHVASPCTLQAIQLSAFGVSNSMALFTTVKRFIVGTGATVFTLGTTFVPPEFGTSGVVPSGVSLPAAGSTLLQLQANDVIYMTTSVSNGAVGGLSVNCVLQPIQDKRSYFAGLV